MKSRFLIILFLMTFMVSCLDNIPRDRPTFAPTQSVAATDNTDEEIPEIEFVPPSRPDGIVIMQSGHCGCLAGEPVTLGACASFCSGKSTQVPTLYVDIEIDEANSIVSGEGSLGQNLNTLNKWCTTEIQYEDPESGEILVSETSPSCRLEVKDEDGVTGSLDYTPVAGATTAQIDITNLDEDKTYRITFVEIVSGARSNTIQVRKVSDPVVDPVGGPLAVEPVFQYSCMSRAFLPSDNGQVLFEGNNRQNFYFIAETRPEPLPGVFPNIYCHDYQIYGETPINNPLLEEQPGVFFTWKKWDPRFFDLNENQKLEIHELLEQKIREQGVNISETPEVFFPLEYPNGPTFSQSSDGSEASQGDSTSAQRQLGYYLTPFIDFEDGFKAYCPTQENYYGTNPLLVAMRDLIGVDTEALYVAKQESICNYIILPESTIKNIWFYIENGQHIEPNSDTIVGKQVQFYWPADPTSPFIKKSDQRTFTVQQASEIGTGSGCPSPTSADASSNTSFPPHDKRIGCIPKLTNGN